MRYVYIFILPRYWYLGSTAVATRRIRRVPVLNLALIYTAVDTCTSKYYRYFEVHVHVVVVLVHVLVHVLGSTLL